MESTRTRDYDKTENMAQRTLAHACLSARRGPSCCGKVTLPVYLVK